MKVYEAHDTRLNRKVAVKVLASEFANEPDLHQRFEREAQAIAALHHPHICVLYDVGHEDGLSFLVMEHLIGETLHDRLIKGPLPLDPVLQYAIEIADALHSAHRAGIHHRDLKPANIMLTKSGAKLLDFGLAKFGAAARSADAVTAMPGEPQVQTGAGIILGTLQYMAPEQLEGKVTDERTDLFAFGALVYEMVTGCTPFAGANRPSLIAAILRDEPPPMKVAVPTVPVALDLVVRACLAKDPDARLQSARDVGLQLQWIHAGTIGAGETKTENRRTRPWIIAAIPAVLLAFVVTVLVVFAAVHAPTSVPFYTQLTFRRGTILNARFAPDGQTVVYSAAWDGDPARVFTTRIGGRESRDLGIQGTVLSVSAAGELAVKLGRFPTGTEVGTLARVSLSGGAPRKLLNDVRAADWDAEGRDLAVIHRLGQESLLEYPIGHTIYRTSSVIETLRVLPDGRIAIFERLTDGGERPGALSIVDRTGSRKVLSSGWLWAGMAPMAWSFSGNEIVFAGTANGELALQAVTLTGHMRVAARVPGDFQLKDMDRSGRILLGRSFPRGAVLARPPDETRERDLSWLDFSYASDLSSDGRQLLLGDYGGLQSAGSIALRNTDGSAVVDLGEGAPLALSPDGLFVLAVPAQEIDDRLLIVPTGAGERRQLQHTSIRHVFDAAWCPDGRHIVVTAGDDPRRARLYLWDVKDGSAPRALTSEGEFGQPVVAPDGNWITTVRTGAAPALYPVDGGPPRSIPGALIEDVPRRWSADGQSLFIRRGSDLPARIERLDIATGRRSLWKELQPAERAGVFGITGVIVTPDGRSYAYTVASSVGALYLAEGLK